MVDLIPADYRRARQLQQLLTRFALACGVILGAVMAARAALDYVLRAEQAQLAVASSQQSRAAAVRARSTQLEQQKLAAEQLLGTLGRLRGIASIDAFFAAVDDAFDARIWFSEMAFSRESDSAQLELSTAVAPGSSATVAGAKAVAEPQVPRERVRIRGHAMDHAVLAEFIRQLQVRDGITQVRLHDTSVRSYTNIQVVDFQLELSLGSSGKAGQ